MEKVVLNASKRDVTGKQVKALRREGKLPAVIYGRHTEPIKINLDAHTAAMTLGKLTASSLVTINLDGTEYPALVREKQRDFIKNRLLHVDFLAVSMSEKLRTSVSVHFIGVSAAVKDFNAVLVKNLEQLEVEALPTDLPERIDVDITALAKPGDGIRVREVQVPDTVRILDGCSSDLRQGGRGSRGGSGCRSCHTGCCRARTGCGTWQEGRRRRRVILSSKTNSPISVGEFLFKR